MTETTDTPTALPLHILEIIENQAESREICDACGPAAYAVCRVILGNGGVLTFCGHHGQRFGYVHPIPQSKLQGSEN